VSFRSKTYLLRRMPYNPRPAGARPLTGHRPWLRVRSGDYRVIYAIDDNAKLVTVAVVGHRRDICRNLSLSGWSGRDC
jgi:mRNA interferase RelE/StbE